MTPAYRVLRPVAATSKASLPVSSKFTTDTDRLRRALHVVRTKERPYPTPAPPAAPGGSNSHWPWEGQSGIFLTLVLL